MVGIIFLKKNYRLQNVTEAILSNPRVSKFALICAMAVGFQARPGIPMSDRGSKDNLLQIWDWYLQKHAHSHKNKFLERPEWIQKATKRRHVEYRSIGGAQSGFNSSSQYQTTCRVDKTNHPVERLSLNRSQCGSCSTKYDTSAGT